MRVGGLAAAIICTLALFLWPAGTLAQSTAEVDKIIEAMMKSCVDTGHVETRVTGIDGRFKIALPEPLTLIEQFSVSSIEECKQVIDTDAAGLRAAGDPHWNLNVQMGCKIKDHEVWGPLLHFLPPP